jgi:arabinose-5-phosphate isomerase
LINEGRALIKLSNELENNGFVDVVRLTLACKGHVVILGIGKSGHIGKKIAASLASTGTPSFFIHPSEAKHGNLGMITGRDLAILISYSGKNEEILSLLPYLYSIGVKTIALTNFSDSELASKTNAHIALKVNKEACPYNLAPTVSSSATLGIGDAIAMALMGMKRFTKEEFSRNHPAGNLGKVLTAKIRDIMVKGDKIPALAPGTSFLDAITCMANKRLGFVVVVDALSRPLGVFTDGDIARVLKTRNNFLDLKVSDVMEMNLKSVRENELVADCISNNVSAILVVDHKGGLLGVSHKHDLATSISV